MKRKGLLFLLISILTLSMLAACGTKKPSSSSDNGGNSGSDSASGEKTYVVATDNSFVPFEFSENGKMTGFDIELVKAIAKEAGFKVDIKGMKFDGIIPGIQSGRYDMGIAGITITDDRAKKVDFSDSYYKAGLILGVQASNNDIKSIDDLKGKKVGTKTGTTSQDYIKNKISGATPVAYDEINQAYQALATGRVDAVLYDLPNFKYYIKTKSDGKLKTVGDRLTAEDYGIAMTKDSGLKEKVDSALATLKENGTYDDLYKKWFGEAPSN